MRPCVSVDNGSIVDAALACGFRDEHEVAASLSSITSLEEIMCCACEHAVNGGKSPAIHHIGSADDKDYARSGGHFGLTCDAAGACAEEPVLTGNDPFGVTDYSDPDNGIAVYDPVDATILAVDIVYAAVLPKVDKRIGPDGVFVTIANDPGDGKVVHAGVCSGCEGPVKSSFASSEESGTEILVEDDCGEASCAECVDEIGENYPAPSPNCIYDAVAADAEGELSAVLSV